MHFRICSVSYNIIFSSKMPFWLVKWCHFWFGVLVSFQTCLRLFSVCYFWHNNRSLWLRFQSHNWPWSCFCNLAKVSQFWMKYLSCLPACRTNQFWPNFQLDRHFAKFNCLITPAQWSRKMMTLIFYLNLFIEWIVTNFTQFPL